MIYQQSASLPDPLESSGLVLIKNFVTSYHCMYHFLFKLPRKLSEVEAAQRAALFFFIIFFPFFCSFQSALNFKVVCKTSTQFYNCSLISVPSHWAPLTSTLASTSSLTVLCVSTSSSSPTLCCLSKPQTHENMTWRRLSCLGLAFFGVFMKFQWKKNIIQFYHWMGSESDQKWVICTLWQINCWGCVCVRVFMRACASSFVPEWDLVQQSVFL